MKMICFSFKGLVHPEIINNNMRVSNKWQNCHFWVNYPFKFIYISTEDLDGSEMGVHVYVMSTT